MIRMFLVIVAAMAAVLSPARAEDAWPTHPIRLIVPFAPGGSTDAQCRILAEAAGKRLGQSIVVENIAGAGGTIGFNMGARAEPDGYTILSATPGIAINPFIQKDIAYDLSRDFAPVVEVATSPVVLVVAASSPIHSVKDLLDQARGAPGQILYGSAGIGAITHLSAALLGSMGGVKFTHVPYRGADPALIDLMAGRIQFQVENAPSVLARIREGQLRAIAVGTLAKYADLPDLPTIAETLPGYDSSSWFGILVPGKTPRPVVERLNAAINDSLADPTVRKAFATFGVDLVGGTPEAFGSFLTARSADMKLAAQAANLTPH